MGEVKSSGSGHEPAGWTMTDSSGQRVERGDIKPGVGVRNPKDASRSPEDIGTTESGSQMPRENEGATPDPGEAEGPRRETVPESSPGRSGRTLPEGADKTDGSSYRNRPL